MCDRIHGLLAPLVILMALTALGIPRGAVLCLDSEGHAALEPAHAACADHQGGPAEQGGGQGLLMAMPMHACHDLPLLPGGSLSITMLQHGDQQAAPAAAPLVWSGPAEVNAPEPHEVHCSQSAASAPPDRALTSLRTVVLTI